MGTRTPPFDYARASALMDQRGVEMLLVCSRANVGYLADYTYYTAQALPFLLEDGREWSLSFVGIPRDPALGAFITPVTGEEGIIRHADPWIEDRRLWGPQWAYVGEATGPLLALRRAASAGGVRGRGADPVGAAVGQVRGGDRPAAARGRGDGRGGERSV